MALIFSATRDVLREMHSTHRELAQKLDDLEQKYQRHAAHTQEIFERFSQLMEQPVPSPRPIDFKPSTHEPPAK
jgi:hypothetical protein